MISDGSTGTKIALKSRDSGTRSWKLWSPAIIRKFRRFVTRKTASTSSDEAGALADRCAARAHSNSSPPTSGNVANVARFVISRGSGLRARR